MTSATCCDAAESAKALKANLAKTEKSIAELEAKIAELEAKMADPETYKSPDAAQEVAREHKQAQETLDAMYESWEELSEAVAELD